MFHRLSARARHAAPRRGPSAVRGLALRALESSARTERMAVLDGTNPARSTAPTAGPAILGVATSSWLWTLLAPAAGTMLHRPGQAPSYPWPIVGPPSPASNTSKHAPIPMSPARVRPRSLPHAKRSCCDRSRTLRRAPCSTSPACHISYPITRYYSLLSGITQRPFSSLSPNPLAGAFPACLLPVCW